MTSSRLTQTIEQIIDIDSIAADIQRGIFPSQSFFGDSNLSNVFSSFMQGAQTSLTYAGASSLKNSLVDKREEEGGGAFKFTKNEYTEIQKKARSISAYGNIPIDVTTDFLMILCFIDKIEDMRIVANAVQIPELDDEDVLRKVNVILEIPKLEKIAYMASAIEGLINLFRKYLKATDISSNKNSGEGMMDIISSLVSGFGGGMNFSNLFTGTSPEELSGNFFSELITGKRIPMNVIAKNPNQQSPSYIGKAFFGEAATALSLIDMDQIFNKKIGVFPMPSSGAGTTAFGLQNLSSFSNTMDIQSLVGKMAFGTSSITAGSKKEELINAFGGKINNLLGTTLDEVVDITRADTAIPIMSAFSAVFANETNSPFSTDTFKNAWLNSNALSNHLQNSNNNILNSIKRFL